jgi:putative tryptophan/tyrosine transport system substrate-binding protein
MKIKSTVLTFCAMFLAVCASASAQQPKKIARVGWLTIGSRSMIPERYEAFRQGLRDLGYIEGQNIVIERANASGKVDRLADAELVRLNVDVIVTTGTTAVYAAKQATSTIPIVMTTGDPLGRESLLVSLDQGETSQG